ncbi:MAG: hypothetical protein IH594_06975, partial [Bacteroidales bacterium]|nr:hypothetical protein [Bacteroidales bacterium]
MASEDQNISRKTGILLFIVISVLILAGGQFYYFQEQKSLKEDKAEALSAVAKLKSGQISSWYRDEIHDAGIIANNNLLVEQIERYLRERTVEELTKLRLILLNTSREHNYQYVLFSDTSWNLVAIEDIQYPVLDPLLHDAVERSLQSKTVVSTGLYLCTLHKTIHIDFISSVTGDEGKILGALIMQIDPFEQFYPLIQTWPTPSKSSETMLVIKEKDSIRYMNELRHVKNTALRKTLPLSDTNYTAVKAVTGSSGIVEGTDYRDINVLSYV